MAKTLQELRDERSNVSADIDKILANADLTDEQRAEVTKLEGEFETLTEQIKTAEKVAADDKERRDRAAARNRELATANPRRTAHATPGGEPRITKEEYADDPKKGFKDHREYLTSIMSAAQTGRVDNRLKGLISPSQQHVTAGSDEHGTYSDPYGGFFVPKGFSPEVLKVDPEADPFAGKTRDVPMQNPTISFNARVDKNHSTSVSGGLRVYRRKETQTVTASRMEHEQVTLNATGLFGVAYATEELLARSVVSFIALLEGAFSDEFNAKLLNEKLNGTGVGEYEGMFNSPCKIAVTKETNQVAATIVKENIDNMRTRAWRYGSSLWVANHGTLPMLRSLVQAIGTGGAVVPYFTISPDGQAMLDGRPLFFTEFCPALGTEGDLALINPSQYLEGTLTAPQSAESMHVRFLEHERAFKFWTENDGRCWWRSALTPKNGPTQSPIVTLATRS